MDKQYFYIENIYCEGEARVSLLSTIKNDSYLDYKSVVKGIYKFGLSGGERYQVYFCCCDATKENLDILNNEAPEFDQIRDYCFNKLENGNILNYVDASYESRIHKW